MSSERITIRLPKAIVEAIDKRLASGLYENRSEVVRELLRHSLAATE